MKAQLAIVGGGATGTLLAVHALRKAKAGKRIVLIEPGRPGRGTAYRTEDPLHLLNVPAGRMSAYASEPGHFVEWLAARLPAVGGGFAPRGAFGTYLEDVLKQEAARSAGSLELLSDEAIEVESVSPEVTRVRLRAVAIEASTLAIATGHHFDARPPAALSSLRAGQEYFGRIWGDRGLIELPSRDARVLILGSGLTMVDAVLTLVSRGHRGKIVALSRRGLLPQPFKPVPAPVPVGLETGATLAAIVREVATACRSADSGGEDWRAVIDGLRSSTPSLWMGMSAADQKRFLRHVRPFWDSHRHRLQPDSASRLHEIVAWHKLELKAGRLLGAKLLTRGSNVRAIQVEYFSKTLGTPAKLDCDVVLNCMGPEPDLGQSAPPLLASLLKSGLARLDRNRLGLETDPDGRLLDREGRAQPGLVTLGPLRRGMLWESTAIPEIRVQAEKLATLLAAGS